MDLLMTKKIQNMKAISKTKCLKGNIGSYALSLATLISRSFVKRECRRVELKRGAGCCHGDRKRKQG